MALHQHELDFLQHQNNVLFQDIFVSNPYRLNSTILKDREVVDIGANIGMFSFFALHHEAKHIIAFEPIPSIYHQFQRNIEHLSAQVTPWNVAIYDGRNETVHMQEDGMTSFISDTGLIVPAWSLAQVNSFVHTNDAVLKIDCEGSEYEILYNAGSRDIRRYEHLILELHENAFDAQHANNPQAICQIERMKDYITFLGYKLVTECRYQAWAVMADGNWTNKVDLPADALHFERI
jgi:FkbM family methyltransferase